MPGLIQVNSGPSTTALATLADTKNDLNLTSTTDDAWITTLINRASAVICNYCGQTYGFGNQTVTETFRFGWEPGVGPASQTVAPYGTPLTVQMKPLILSYAPVTNIASVTENGTLLSPSDPDYEYDAIPGLVYRLNDLGMRTYWSVPTIVVQYSFGYQLPNDSPTSGVMALPPDIEQACIALVKSAYYARGRDPNVAMDWTEGGGRTQYWDRSANTMTIDPDIAAMLSPYVNRVF